MNTITLSINSDAEQLPEDIVDSLNYSQIQDLILAIDRCCQDVDFTETLICDLISSLQDSVQLDENHHRRMIDFKDFLRNMEYLENP